LPSNALLLDPFSKKSLSREDSIIARNGIVALDCSWNKIENNAFKILKKKMHPRALPFLLASNPVNYGKAFKLTTAEAIASALYIIGEIDGAKEILSIFKWGEHFFTLNGEPLEDYRKSKTSEEVIEKMMQYV
jgi:pre-rRNA-processing protein TSR3